MNSDWTPAMEEYYRRPTGPCEVCGQQTKAMRCIDCFIRAETNPDWEGFEVNFKRYKEGRDRE